MHNLLDEKSVGYMYNQLDEKSVIQIFQCEHGHIQTTMHNAQEARPPTHDSTMLHEERYNSISSK